MVLSPVSSTLRLGVIFVSWPSSKCEAVGNELCVTLPAEAGEFGVVSRIEGKGVVSRV